MALSVASSNCLDKESEALANKETLTDIQINNQDRQEVRCRSKLKIFCIYGGFLESLSIEIGEKRTKYPLNGMNRQEA